MNLRVKSESDGSVSFEGFANKAIVDRGNDLIGKKAWKLDNYKKNPIILFNHDHTKPIGKMISVEPKEEGLFVRGKISSSRDPDISRIRDLVKEGILNSLSVGMRVHDEERENDVNVIKSAELHEISIVAVPMNQDSQFTASTKSMEGQLVDVMGMITKEVGTADVSKAYERLHSSSEVFDDFGSMSTHIAKASGCTAEDAEKFLKMQSESTPAAIQGWLEKADEPVEMVDPVEPLEPAEDAGEEKDPMNGKQVYAILIPKASIETSDELSAWAESSGWKSDLMEEDEEDYILIQSPKEGFKGEMQTVDLGDGIRAMVGVLGKEEGEGQESAEPLEEEESAGDPPLEEQKGLLDNAMTQPLQGKQPEQIEVNPSLDQARQTNVLLANVVTLLQQLNEKLPIMQAPTPDIMTPAPDQTTVEVVQEPEAASPEEEELAKQISSFINRTQDRLKTLGL